MPNDKKTSDSCSTTQNWGVEANINHYCGGICKKFRNKKEKYIQQNFNQNPLNRSENAGSLNINQITLAPPPFSKDSNPTASQQHLNLAIKRFFKVVDSTERL